MADKKISQLTSATTPLAGTEVLPIVQGTPATTVKTTVSSITASGAYPGYFTALRSYRAGVSQSLQIDTAGGATTVAAINDANTSEMPINLQVKNTGIALTTVASVNSTGLTTFGNLKASRTGGIDQVLQLSSASGQTRIDAINNVNTSEMPIYFGYSTTGTSLTTNASLTSSALTLNTGNLVIGTSGKGIDFSAAGGDVLTTYDEGSFTPTLLSGTCTGTAYYTRIGRQVNVFGTISYATDGSGPVGVTIGNMPFAAAQNVRGFAGWSGIALDAGDTQAACYMASGSDDLVFLGYPSGSGIDASRWLAGAVLSFNITYIV